MDCINQDFEKLRLTTGDKITLQYQLRDADNNPVDITDLSFQFAAKIKATDVDYQINPVIADKDDIPNGIFSFTITLPAIEFRGLYEIIQKDGSGDELTLTPAGGVEIQVLTGII